MKLLALIAAVLLLPQEKNEAEKLFRSMEEKIAKAKSVQFSWKLTAKVKQGEITVEATILLDEGNRVRIDTKGKMPGVDEEDLIIQDLIISDGTKLKSVGSRNLTVNTPSTLNKTLQGCLTRGGPSYTLMVLNMSYYSKESDPARLITLSNFAMGKTEKVEERESQVIDFKSTLGLANKQESTVKLWIDIETGLPVKRVFVVNEMNQEITTTEVYTSLKLDGKIDPSKFELPKER